MFANKINPETGNPICMCGKDCTPDPTKNGLVMGSKGLIILHNECIETHNQAVMEGRI